jgi:hypothetical protein
MELPPGFPALLSRPGRRDSPSLMASKKGIPARATGHDMKEKMQNGFYFA